MGVTLAGLLSVTALTSSSLVGGPLAGSASADTAPVGDAPATVSADGLPTVQITGIVWDQVLIGNRVYATGSFTRARPAGAPAGTDEVVRENLLAYDIRTGELLPFDHRLNGTGHAIAASPDGRRLYVGGDFTTVDGDKHVRVAAFNPRTGTLVKRFKGAVSARVTALDATNDAVYVGGEFSLARGKDRQRLAAFDKVGRVLAWAPTANNSVRTLLVTPDTSKVLVGGNLTRLSGKWFWGFGAVNRRTGKPVLTWASHDRRGYRLRNGGDTAGITSMSTDGTRLYLTGYRTSPQRPVPYGQFEGRAAVNLKNGRFFWISDCHGDSYDTVPIGDVLYSVGHAHDCQPAGYFPELDLRPRRALAETVYKTHLNGPPTDDYASFEGEPAPDQLVWYPSFTAGSYSGASQAAWSIVGNSDYVALGGEFPTVNSEPQQGLVRFAVRSLAPNEVGPENYQGNGVTVQPADGDGNSVVSWTETWDKDNALLDYALYRQGSDTPVCRTTAESRFWLLDPMQCTDSGLSPGERLRYQLVVTDPLGNTTTTLSPAVN